MLSVRRRAFQTNYLEISLERNVPQMVCDLQIRCTKFLTFCSDVCFCAYVRDTYLTDAERSLYTCALSLFVSHVLSETQTRILTHLGYPELTLIEYNILQYIPVTYTGECFIVQEHNTARTC